MHRHTVENHLHCHDRPLAIAFSCADVFTNFFPTEAVFLSFCKHFTIGRQVIAFLLRCIFSRLFVNLPSNGIPFRFCHFFACCSSSLHSATQRISLQNNFSIHIFFLWYAMREHVENFVRFVDLRVQRQHNSFVSPSQPQSHVISFNTIFCCCLSRFVCVFTHFNGIFILQILQLME